MTMATPRRRSRLLERTWESFVGFSDRAVEVQFLVYEIQRRKTLLSSFAIFYVLLVFSKMLHKAITGTLTAADLLLHPTSPINCLLSAIALVLGRWRWVEPLSNAGVVVRTVGELLWLAPTISLECVSPWDGYFASQSTCITWLLLNVTGNFVQHVRFKVAFWVLMFHIATVPFIVHKSPAELSTMWMVIAFVTATGLRLWYDTQCRAAFRKLHSTPAKVAKEEDTCSCDLTDQELEELVHQAKQGIRSAAAVSTQHTVFLRIPGADPSDMGPEAKVRLRHELEAQFPGCVITNITFQRGSLLVGIKISCPGEAEDAGSSVECLKRVGHSTWLTWLGLPADMDMSVKVDIPAERRVSWLDGFPLAVAVHASEQGFATLALPLRCSQCPQDVAFKASLGDCILDCRVLVTSSDEGEGEGEGEGEASRSPGAKQSCITLQVELPASALCASPCCLLTVNVQSTTDHLIIGDRTVVLLLNELTDMECDFSSMRLLRPSDMTHGHKIHSQEEPSGVHLAYGVGWWLKTMHEGGAVAFKQLLEMWRSGNYLLLDLVHNGCVAVAKHVVHVLLTSQVLRPFVHERVPREGSDCIGTFLDYFHGAINPRASSALHLAVISGCCAMVDEVLRWIQVYNLPCLWDVKDQFGMTPLHLAVLVNEGKMASFLLRKGDPVLLHAWHHNTDGRSGSPEQFSKRMARLSTGAGGMVDHQGRRKTGTMAPARQRDIPTLRSTLRAPAPSQVAHALPTVRAPAPQCAGEEPAAPGSGHVAHCQPLGGLPPMPPHADGAAAAVSADHLLGIALLSKVSSNMKQSADHLGVALLSKASSNMKQLWCCLAPFPDAAQEKRFNRYRVENNSMVLSTLCLLQIPATVSVALKEGGTSLLLHSILLLWCCSILLLHAIYKRDYGSAEKYLLGWMFLRLTLFIWFHLSGALEFTSFPVQMWRPWRSSGEPIRFTWALAENLGALVITCVICKEASLHWLFLLHFVGLLTTVALQIRDRNKFMALEKSR